MPAIVTVYDDLVTAVTGVTGLTHSGRPIDVDNVPDGHLAGAFSIELTSSVDSDAPARWKARGRIVHSAAIIIARRTKPDNHNATYREILENEHLVLKAVMGPGAVGTGTAVSYVDTIREYSESREWIVSNTGIELRCYLELL